jgi:hypothetical protein
MYIYKWEGFRCVLYKFALFGDLGIHLWLIYTRMLLQNSLFTQHCQTLFSCISLSVPRPYHETNSDESYLYLNT